ncbi:hypothetical protein [Leptothermofonsia sp. ETS-13]|uniref:hypothetical protein n=1 Tax=Leptothermofonsia sp. ETS-13 TaxID=3035696 RepID=UPI003BA1E183
MVKKALIPSIALLPLLSAGNVLAASESSPPPVPSISVQPPMQPKCHLLAQAIAQNPAVEDDKIVGTVYSVIGNTVMIEKEDGTTEHVYLDWWERGHMGQLVGKKVVVRDVYCNRIDLAPPPPPVVKPIEVPALQFTPVTPTVPPLTPRPVAEPAPAQEPQQIVPQTW